MLSQQVSFKYIFFGISYHVAVITDNSIYKYVAKKIKNETVSKWLLINLW
jgi:hypothetical protein